jgi:hypothetical protein
MSLNHVHMDTRFSPCLQVESTQLSPIDRVSLCLRADFVPPEDGDSIIFETFCFKQKMRRNN